MKEKVQGKNARLYKNIANIIFISHLNSSEEVLLKTCFHTACINILVMDPLRAFKL